MNFTNPNTDILSEKKLYTLDTTFLISPFVL